MAGEANLQRRIMRDLKTIPHCYCVKIERAVGGTLDIHVGLRGRFIAIEVKGEGGRLSKLQKHVIQKIEDAQCLAFSVWPEDWPAVFDYLKTIHVKKRRPR